jgi:hypothetical protein
MIDGFVKSQIGSLRCLLSGVSTPAAKFQELVASSSNSLEVIDNPDKANKPPLLDRYFDKCSKLQKILR